MTSMEVLLSTSFSYPLQTKWFYWLAGFVLFYFTIGSETDSMNKTALIKRNQQSEGEDKIKIERCAMFEEKQLVTVLL